MSEREGGEGEGEWAEGEAGDVKSHEGRVASEDRVGFSTAQMLDLTATADVMPLCLLASPRNRCMCRQRASRGGCRALAGLHPMLAERTSSRGSSDDGQPGEPAHGR